MAQIEQSDKGGKKKKGAQKKMAIHVDFTPMVDMNMLLITFFMLCTTMMKSQILKIALPTNEKVDNVAEMSQAAESDAITLILDAEREADGTVKKDASGNTKTVVYNYEGAPKFVAETGEPMPGQVKTKAFDGNNVETGIRNILHERNKAIIEEVEKLKGQWRNNEFSSNKDENQRIYEEKAKEVRNNKDYKPPVVVIKATPEASWESVISALDEMDINEISRYQIDNINATDYKLLGRPVPAELQETAAAAPGETPAN